MIRQLQRNRNLWPGRYKSGYTYSSPINGVTATLCTNGALRAIPFPVGETTTFDKIGAEVTTIGEAGSVVRLGIYSDTNGIPVDLFADYGTIDGTSATYQTITPAGGITLTPGLWWLASVAQLGTTTPPTCRFISQGQPFIGHAGNPSTTTTTSYGGTTTTTGSLPSTFGTPSVQGNCIRVNLRAQ